MSKPNFITLLRKEAENKVKELRQLIHEKHRLEMQQARTAEYIKAMNEFLVQQGYEPVPFEEIDSKEKSKGK